MAEVQLLAIARSHDLHLCDGLSARDYYLLHNIQIFQILHLLYDVDRTRRLLRLVLLQKGEHPLLLLTRNFFLLLGFFELKLAMAILNDASIVVVVLITQEVLHFNTDLLHQPHALELHLAHLFDVDLEKITHGDRFVVNSVWFEFQVRWID